MPIYEYRCPNGHTFELFQKMTDEPATDCQVCGASPVEKILFPVAVHYKGSGFYSTDYGKGGSARKKDSAGETGSGTASSDSGAKTETSSGAGSGSSEKKAAAAD